MKTSSLGKGKFKLAVLLTLCAVVLGCATFLCFNIFNKHNTTTASADTTISAPVWKNNNSTSLEAVYNENWKMGYANFQFLNYNSTYMTMSGYEDWANLYGSNAIIPQSTITVNVTHTMTFTANDGYYFPGGAKTATLSFKATQETSVSKPYINGDLTAYYAGSSTMIVINDFNSAAMTISGASAYYNGMFMLSGVAQSDIGKVKTVTITLKEGFTWTDESVDPVVFNITIKAKQNAITLIYSGDIYVFTDSAAPALTATTDKDKAVFSIKNGTGAGTINAKTGVITPTKAGTITVSVYIPSSGDYAAGNSSTTIIIKARNISNVTIGTIGTQYYTGSEVKPKPSVTDTALGTTLVEGTDFEYSYENNIELGEATLTVTYKGNYTGTDSKTFTISKRDISKTSFGEIADQYYNNGLEIKPTPTITDTILGTTLVEGTDFEFSYSNNTAVGEATITITGKGNYTGTKSTTFTILGIDISVCTIGTITACTYDGTAKKPTATVSLNGTTLSSSTDFTFSYKDNINAGEATLTVTGKGNYSGKNSKTFTISARDISNATVADIAAQSYTGEAVEPLPVVTDLERTLVKDTDYTLSYEHNTAVGTATLTITGKGNFEGTVTANFKIVADINKVTVTGIDAEYEYKGFAITPEPVVTLSGATLVKGTDYTVEYSGNTDLGTATVTITGKDKYNSTTTVNFAIIEANISNATVTGIDKNYEYTGSEITPEPTVTLNGKTLVEGTDYTVAYRNNLNLGAAVVDINGIGNYKGTKSTAFTIGKANIAKAQVNAINASYEQTGDALEPLPVVTIDGDILTKDVDYTVEYSSNVNIGTATYTITGIGNYTGSISGTFKITIAQPKVEVVYASYNGTDKLFVGKQLPEIRAIATYDGAPVEGTISWDLEEPVLKVGNNDYYWTFTPADLDKFAVVTGFKTLTAEKPNYVAIRVEWKGGSQPELFTSTSISVLKHNLEVTGIFSSGDTDEIAGGYSLVGSWDNQGVTNTVKMPTVGGNNFGITVSFGSWTDTIVSVEIKDVVLTEFTVDDSEISTEYTALNKFDTSSLVVVAKYNDGTEKTLNFGNKGYTVVYENGADSLRYGDTKVTVSFTDKGVTKTVEIDGLNVKKANPVSNPTVGGNLSVGKSLSELTIVASGDMPAGKLTWDNTTYVLQEGSNRCYYTFTPDDTENYNVVRGYIDVTASKAPVSNVTTNGAGIAGWGIALIIICIAVVIVTIVALIIALKLRRTPSSNDDGFGDNVTWDDLK